MYAVLCTRPVRKISNHFHYTENRSRGLDVTWQPVRGDITVHLWTVTLPWGLSVGSETPLTELVYCVTVAFPPNRASKLAPSRQCVWPFYSSRAGFFVKTSHNPRLSAPLRPRFGSLRLWLFPKLKSPLKLRRFVKATVTQYTSSVNSFSLQTD